MKKAFSIVLSILFTIGLFITLLLSIVRFNFSYSQAVKLFSDLMKPVSVAAPGNDGLFYPENKQLSLAGFEDFDAGEFDFSTIDFANMDFNEIVQQYLDANEIDVEPEVIADILASPEVLDAVDKYADEIINYITGETTEINIDPKELTQVMNVVYDKYEAATGEVVDRTGLEEAVANTVEEIVPDLTQTLDEVKEENADALEIFAKINYFLSLKFWIICIAVCVVLALAIFLINMNVFIWFKYISIPVMIDGVLIFIGTLIAKGVVPGMILELIKEAGLSDSIYHVIWNFAFSILKKIETCAFITTLLGVVLCCLGYTLGKKKSVAASTEK